ncbi:hypothetical protein OIE66_28830 [Nonomuraea sp. NBC_01738]|uniref:hypothetical protein n=1 Tax=Nonomuraea sp. NBC_01738 TaxID=2976003 RepID=UPI002E150CB0|nr:hypothetical protein OIE66_28830 [Nonomuraea sp. NBC_01738]
MSREGADYELRARAQERDRISADLLDLEEHDTYQLLKGAVLRGETARRWASAQASVVVVWALNDLYRAALRQAEEVRARRSKPGTAELAELTALLAGPSVVLKAEQKPVELRSLGTAEPDEHLTLEQTVDRMDDAFGEVTAVLQAVDTVWDVALPLLQQAERTMAALGGLQHDLGERLDLHTAETGLSRVRADVVEDPLGTPPAKPELTRLTGLLDTARAGLERALAARNTYNARREQLITALEDVRQAESEARIAHGGVVVKIALPPTAAPRNHSDALAARMAELDASADGWMARADRLTALEHDMRRAAEQARTTAKALAGLLARRDELRGRLVATQAKAARTGLAEDAGAVRLFEEARLLLWTAPCDLTLAAAAVDHYQHAISGGGR